MSREKIDLSGYNHVLFTNNFQKLKYAIWLVIANLFFLTNIPYPVKFKIFILKLFGAKIGQSCIIKPWVKIKFPWNLEIENNVWIGEEVWIDNISMVKIKSNSCISQRVLIITGNHRYDRKFFDLDSKPIFIEEGVWIGANSTIYGGARLNSHAVLLGNSSTNTNLEEYTIYHGNPAISLKPRTIT